PALRKVQAEVAEPGVLGRVVRAAGGELDRDVDDRQAVPLDEVRAGPRLRRPMLDENSRLDGKRCRREHDRSDAPGGIHGQRAAGAPCADALRETGCGSRVATVSVSSLRYFAATLRTCLVVTALSRSGIRSASGNESPLASSVPSSIAWAKNESLRKTSSERSCTLARCTSSGDALRETICAATLRSASSSSLPVCSWAAAAVRKSIPGPRESRS